MLPLQKQAFMPGENVWKINIDTGGTFTDCIAQGPDGQLLRTKVLSSGCLRGRILQQIAPNTFHISQNWRIDANIFDSYSFRSLSKDGEEATVVSIDLPNSIMILDRPIMVPIPSDFELFANEEAPVLAARLITKTPLNQPFPPLQMRVGSTKGTNALLEQQGANTAFLVTKGFKDLIPIGTQQRPDLFQLDIPPPVLLYQQVLEVPERIAAEGTVLQHLTEIDLHQLIDHLKKHKIASVAIALLNAYRNPVHEQLLSQRLQEEGFQFVSASQALSPAIKLLPRAQTALVNAYLAPVIHNYIRRIRQKMESAGQETTLRIMTSAGGLVDASLFHPKDSLLSGPAGGVVGAAAIAEQLGIDKILTLDMGGTSTDTARYDGQFDYQYITKVGPAEMTSPTLAIETVAAGGGSICYFEDGRLQVGPESAGARPGPACYGAGGPLTITDVNLLLGKLDPSGMGIPIRADRAMEALENLRKELDRTTGIKHTNQELLLGFEQIANEKMAEAIRRISVAKGFDPSPYALLVFGGAGGLHGCKLAELLKIKRIVLPFDAGLLSAYGISQARITRFAYQQILKPLEECKVTLPAIVQSLCEKASALLAEEGIDSHKMEILSQQVFLRFKGQDSSLEVPFSNTIEAAFEESYRKLFGHYPENGIIELESVKVIAGSKRENRPSIFREVKKEVVKSPHKFTAPIDGQQIPVFDWEELKVGDQFHGPAILRNAHATAFIEASWQLEIVGHEKQALVHYTQPSSKTPQSFKQAVALELFTNRFSAIAEEMGAQLQRTAFSVNIKERLDFSCAILDPQGELLVNAPHIPVHLGSLGICARLCLERLPLRPGDVILTNHPKYGGSHLPDITLLSAVFTEKEELIGYVINRAHHAEIGGKRPGSMPPDARSLAEEGVSFVPIYIVEQGKVQWQKIRKALEQAPFPSRMVDDNLADLNAALAALRTGEQALKKLVNQHSLPKVHHYMKALKQMAGQTLAEALKPYEGQTYHATEKLDDGYKIKVQIQNTTGQLVFDFSGTSGVHPYNLNANISIVFSAVLYFLRILCDKPIPLNEGLMQQVEIRLPEDSFLHPKFEDEAQKCPAVVGGNTEVSQRLVDTLLKAFGLAACSQGTMNNFLFGNDHFGYYETIGGGTGSGPGFNGRSAVHQHMTNTRITDPEDLEFRYPVRLIRFEIREGSGGTGKWKGGDGIIREVEFLESMEVTLLTQHRKEAPYGLEGGQAGAIGVQKLIKKNGEEVYLQGVDSIQAEKGDRICIATPGGGGFQAKEE